MNPLEILTRRNTTANGFSTALATTLDASVTVQKPLDTTFQPIGLGDRVKDPVTGFTGIVLAVTTWLHGCIRIIVASETLKDGSPGPEAAFDQSQLVLLERRVHTPQVLGVVPAPAPEVRRSNGGPAREGANFKRA